MNQHYIMLTYSLVSTLIAGDRSKVRQGMRRLAEVAHKHDIPITWGDWGDMLHELLLTDLTEWHTSHGDETRADGQYCADLGIENGLRRPDPVGGAYRDDA